jgi:phosphoribosylamine--glycine ligase
LASRDAMGKTLRTLVIGGGGREHAICWSLRRSPQVIDVLCTPGNAGIAEIATCLRTHDKSSAALVELAQRERVDLTIVGPEQPLAEGVVDEFQRAGLRIYGPNAAASRLESSKIFAKEFMRRHAIPTAPFRVFDKAEEALEFIAGAEGPLVVKADGLASGKGVDVCTTREQAQQSIKRIMVERAFGAAGDRVIIERMLTGEEMSVMAFADGQRAVMMLPARDYKRLEDGDKGPNTGGMGAYAPARTVEDDQLAEIGERILQKTVDGMRADGVPFVGVLYAGLMITEAGPRVLEFNCRFGDPETEVVLPLLKTDLVDVIGASLAGRLDLEPLTWSEEYCAGVILAARGYPGRYEGNVPIEGDVRTEQGSILCFHGGTSRDEQGRLTSSGGRILGVYARASTHEGAVASAYSAAERIRIRGAQYRRDIGLRTRRIMRPRRVEAQTRR